MEKYRLISIWRETYVPKSYRQDGLPQERVEEIGIDFKEAIFSVESNKKSTNIWKIIRYEKDDGLYRKFELIMPKILNEPEKKEIKTSFKIKTEPKYKVKSFCRCLHEIENGLPVTEYCFMACPEQKEILKQRKQEKRNENNEHG